MMLRLNNYNNWSGPTTDEVKELLYRFDRVNLPERYQAKCGITPAMIRERNPSARIYRHFVMCAKNDWDTDWGVVEGDMSALQTPLPYDEIVAHGFWLRDGNDEIVKENDHTWFLDVGKRWFKETYALHLINRMKDGGFDGVVFDYWIDNLYILKGRPRPKRYPTDEDWAEKAWKPFLAYVIGAVRDAGYGIIGNCAGEYNTPNQVKQWQRTLVDGTVYEKWSVGWGGEYLPVGTIDTRIEAFRDDPLEAWTASYGLQNTFFSDWEHATRLSLAMYYIALPNDSTQSRSYHHYGDMTLVWEPIWDFDIGEPSEPAVKLSPGVWSREFTEGIVLFNYSDSVAEFPTEIGYVGQDGTRPRGVVRVEPKDSMILARG